MRVVFMGTPDFSVGTLRELAKAGHEIAGVISQPDKPKGRGKNLQPTPVKEAAMELGLPVYQPQKVRDPEFIQVMKELNPDVIVVVAFGQIIPKEILHMPKYGCINVHGSLLPKYRGGAPIHRAIMNGEKALWDASVRYPCFLRFTLATLNGFLFGRVFRESIS